MDENKDTNVHDRGVRTQRIIIVVMLIFTIVPLIVAWISGSFSL